MKRISELNLLNFLMVLVSVPLFWIIRGDTPDEFSLIENRKLTPFAEAGGDLAIPWQLLIQGDPNKARSVLFDQINDRVFQQSVEQAASDQFPLRIPAIRLSKFFDRLIITLAYAFLPDPAVPTDMRSGLYVMRDGSQIIFGPASFDTLQEQSIDTRIDNYASLISSYPEIHFSAFYFERLEYSPDHPLNSYFPHADRGQSFRYFEKNKPAGLMLEKMMLTGFEDHARYFYRTDHHWNIHGVLQAYAAIHDLLKQSYPQISPPIEFGDFFTFQDIGFLGSLARKSLYPIGPDKFEVISYDLPPHQILENGQEIIYTQADHYLAGNYPTAPYTSHYIAYFGDDLALLEYVFENGSDRNLLLIGNSFDNPLQPLIAYHYHHTYSIDLRFYDDFSLSDLLSQYEVDDILIIGGSDVVCIDNEWLIDP